MSTLTTCWLVQSHLPIRLSCSHSGSLAPYEQRYGYEEKETAQHGNHDVEVEKSHGVDPGSESKEHDD